MTKEKNPSEEVAGLAPIIDMANAASEDIEAETVIQVAPFLEVRTSLGSRTWIRKASIVGVDEVSACDWDDLGGRAEVRMSLIHTVGGKTWKIQDDAAEVIRALGQAEL